MVHAGARSVRDRYAYVSDSNGYWRFERLPEVLAAGAHERLHVLTHPEWWQEQPMSPRERILRCIEGRGRASEATYDALLADNRARQRRAAGTSPLSSAWMIDSPCGASKSCGIRSIPCLAEQLVLLIAPGAATGQIRRAADRADDVDQQFGGAAVDVEIRRAHDRRRDGRASRRGAGWRARCRRRAARCRSRRAPRRSGSAVGAGG